MISEEGNRIIKLEPTTLPPGYGPRHMAITTKNAHSQQFAYVLNELKSFISIFKFDEKSGKLSGLGEVEMMPANLKAQSAAGIDLHPTEKWLYCSNRVCNPADCGYVDCNNCTNGSMIVYKVQKNGQLEKIQVIIIRLI